MNATQYTKATRSAGTRHWTTLARYAATVATIFALAVPASATRQTATSPQELLGQAMHQETGVGDLPAAMALYERVVAHGSVDLGTRLQAELRLADLLAKTGDPAGSRELLERIVGAGTNDAAHSEITDAAREALAAMSGNASPAQDRIRLREPEFIREFVDATTRSPDGRYGAFTDYLGTPRQEPGAQGGGVDGYNVVVVDYETEELTRLTDFAEIEDGISDIPVWAPDGRQLAYAVKGPTDDHEVRIFTVGGASRTVFRRAPVGSAYFSAEPSSWSPDGRALALLLDNGDESATVAILDVASGDLTQLASFSWPRGQVPGPEFSPDGRYLAFVATVDGSNEIFALSVDGSRKTQLTNDPGTDGWPLWSRDGSHLLFVSDRLGANALWAIPLQDGRATAAPLLLYRSWPGWRGFRWIGDRLAYSERLYPRDVYTLPLDAGSGTATGPARKVDYRPPGPQVGIAWSRDESLAFFSRTNPDKVVVLHPDGTMDDFRIPVEWVESLYGGLQFDATGTVVSFGTSAGMVSVDTESGEWSVERLPVDGRSVVRGPEPDTLFYGTRTTPFRIRRLDLRSGETTDVFEFDQEAVLHRTWLSPDATRLRIANGRTFSELDLMSDEVEDLFTVGRDLPVGSCTGNWGDISPDGSKMAIAGTEELFVVDLESGESNGLGVRLDELFAWLPADMGTGCFRLVRWSPSGNQLAFMAQNAGVQWWTIPDPLEAVLGNAGSR